MALFRRKRHGCWIEIEYRRGFGYKCSECFSESNCPYDICPDCGAVMGRGIIDESEAFELLGILLDDDY